MKRLAFHLASEEVQVAASHLPPPVVTYDTTQSIWRLEATYRHKDKARLIAVAAGFEFDLASIPRVFWWLIAPFELSVVAVLLHDFLYRYHDAPPPESIVPPHKYSRHEVDVFFAKIMEEEGVTWWRRKLAYYSVRSFGECAWRSGSHRPLKRRIPLIKKVRDRLKRGRAWVKRKQPSRQQVFNSLPVFIVALTFSIFLLLWHIKQEWRPVLVPVGTGLGALLGVVPGLLSERMRGQWTSAIVGSLLVALVAWYTTVSLTKELASKSSELEALRLVTNDLKSYLPSLSTHDKNLILKHEAELLGELYDKGTRTWPPTFESAHETVWLIQAIDKTNGHALYFLGEMGRKAYPRTRENGRQEFYLYIESEKNYPQNDGVNVSVCDKSVSGYCKQRSAWIRHLLANDFYKEGLLKERDFPRDMTAVEHFGYALDKVCEIYKLYSGFSDPDQLTPTKELERQLRVELNKLGQEAKNCPSV